VSRIKYKIEMPFLIDEDGKDCSRTRVQSIIIIIFGFLGGVQR
jgi:hypothetical protein